MEDIPEIPKFNEMATTTDVPDIQSFNHMENNTFVLSHFWQI